MGSDKDERRGWTPTAKHNAHPLDRPGHELKPEKMVGFIVLLCSALLVVAIAVSAYLIVKYDLVW